MTPLAPDSLRLWLLVAALGVGTFALRLSFIQVHAWIEEFPPALERALAFVPAAVLAALVFPELIAFEGLLSGTAITPRTIAGVIAALVAWRTGSMIATIGVGMGVLWTVQFLVA